MSSRVRAIAAIGALISLPSGVALGARFPVGSPPPAPPKVTTYTGSDAVGQVRFRLVTPLGENGKPAGPSAVRNFHFANKCSKSGTTVNNSITVGPKHRFAYHHGGVSITGVIGGQGFSQASGTARTHTAACDSGLLSFTAAPPTAPSFTG